MPQIDRMLSVGGLRRAAAFLLLPTMAGIALVWAGSRDGLHVADLHSRLALLLFLALCVFAGALHRPLDGQFLGLGALPLPASVVMCGVLPTAVVAGLALLAAELALRLDLQRRGVPRRDRRQLGRSVEAAATASLATLGGGWAWLRTAGPWSVPAAATFAVTTYLGVLVLLEAGMRQLHRPRRPIGVGTSLVPLGIDLVALGAGAAVAGIGLRLGPSWLAVVLGALVLLILEARRHAVLRTLAEHRAFELEAIHHAGRRLVTTGRELETLARQIRRECRSILPFHWFRLELLQEPDERRSWYAGPDALLRSGEPEPGEWAPPLPGIHRRAAWQLIERELATDQPLARLRFWCDPRLLPSGAAEQLDRLVPQLTGLVHRALLDREARHDPLTGLVVRRILDRRLEEAYEHCLETGDSMAVVLCDLDHFKQINDTYGHDAGDQALVLVARVLEQGRREEDLCCRYGGEEFALFLEDTGGIAALLVAERLRQAMEELDFVFAGKHISLALSAGIAAYPELHIKAPSELVSLADEALYEAKRRGRNRCLLHLGRGRYRTPDSSILEDREKKAALKSPRLFA